MNSVSQSLVCSDSCQINFKKLRIIRLQSVRIMSILYQKNQV